MVRPHTVRAPSAPEGSVLHLDDEPAALDASLVGAKAAALATARRAGFPVQPGAVITTAGLARWRSDPAAREELRRAWSKMTHDGRDAVIVRSSSTVEDSAQSSMAGRFTSILDRDTFASVCAAVDQIIDHAAGVSAAPLAVLVQPMLDARSGGVLFGADPVHGRMDRFVVAAIASGPDALVSGAEHGARYTITPRGRVVEAESRLAGIGRRELRQLAALARSLNRLFGSPQDIEWAIDGKGELQLLQSRPITTVAPRTRGPVLGPGPVAETFPDRLSVLEADLWVPPLDAGVREAMAVAGVRRRGASGPVVSDLDGWVVADLGALEPPRRSLRTVIDPRRGARRLRASWRTGRLRAVLPSTAREVVLSADEQLRGVPPLASLADAELLAVLERSCGLLRSLHAHEVLCGLAMRGRPTMSASGASAALDALAAGHSRGLDDDVIIAAWPEVLALSPPGIRPRTPLPPVQSRLASVPHDVAALDVEAVAGLDEQLARHREHLRLRARWVHELTALAAFELGRRFTARGRLPDASAVRDLALDEIRRSLAVGDAPVPSPRAPSIASVPSRFVLDLRGRPVPVRSGRRRGRADGQGAGGGRSVGTVVADRAEAGPGTVLVVATLDPALASVLPGLGGLVAETGSVLSHLAILAREHGVATVVGVPEACRRWPPGSVVEVDGSAGTVVAVGGGGPAGAAVTP